MALAVTDQSDTQRLYVVGNGPSLKDYDFERLRGQAWIGMNSAYRHWDRLGHYPRYYCCLDEVVGQSHAEQIIRLIREAEKLGIEKFLLRDGILGSNPDLSNLDRVYWSSDLFGAYPLLMDRITTGSHATLWGAILGYRHMTLLGIDQNYTEQVDGLEQREGTRLEVVKATTSPNYYFEDYQQVGDRLNQPNPVPYVHEIAWRRVMNVLIQDYASLDIINASPVSSIPGTRSLHGTGPALSNRFRLRLSPDQSLEEALSLILPSRFVEIEDAQALLPMLSGPEWRKVPDVEAVQKGRWHIKLGRNGHVDTRTELGSFVWIPGADGSPDPVVQDQSLLPFDQVIELAVSDQVRAVLALKSDTLDIGKAQAQLDQATRWYVITSRAKRLFWRLVRGLDRVRPSRSPL